MEGVGRIICWLQHIFCGVMTKNQKRSCIIILFGDLKTITSILGLKYVGPDIFFYIIFLNKAMKS